MKTKLLKSTLRFFTLVILCVGLGVLGGCGTGSVESQSFNSDGIFEDPIDDDGGDDEASTAGNSESAADEIGADGEFDRSENELVAQGFRIVSPPQATKSATFSHVIDFDLTQPSPVFDGGSDLFQMPDWFVEEE